MPFLKLWKRSSGEEEDARATALSMRRCQFFKHSEWVLTRNHAKCTNYQEVFRENTQSKDSPVKLVIEFEGCFWRTNLA